MNSTVRSFFSVLVLGAAAMLTGCANTGNANQDRIINGALAGAAIGAITASVTNPRPQQHAQYQPQHSQPQSCRHIPPPTVHQCRGGTGTGWVMNGCTPVQPICNAPQQHQPQQTGCQHGYYQYGNQCLLRPLVTR